MQKNKGIWNYGNYSNSEVDRLNEIIRFTMDPSTRKELIEEVFSIAIGDVAWVPLYSSKSFYGIRDYIEWSPRPSSYMIFEEISFL
jgi:ABC-type transport system substrate-binding protein